MSLDDDVAVALRPHYRRRGRELFFLVAKKPRLALDDSELALFDAIDGSRTVGELCANDSDRLASLRRWHQAEIIDLIAPRPPGPDRPHLVVVEPHLDDAVLSAGGRLLNRRGKQRTTILTITRWSNFTSYWFKGRFPFDMNTVTELRLAECRQAARLVGADMVVMNEREANLRSVPAEAWSEASIKRLFDAYWRGHFHSIPFDDEVEAWSVRIAERIAELDPDELWIPLGLGEHIDHRLARDACLRMIARDRQRFAGMKIELYEDLPYATEFPHHAAQIREALARVGTRIEPKTEPIADVFEEKLRAVGVFASQSKLDHMAPKIREAAEQAGARGHLAERSHALVELGSTAPPPTALSAQQRPFEKLRPHIGPFLERRASIRRLAVFAAAPFARFPEEMDALLEIFPYATVVVFVLAEHLWQTEGFRHARVEVRAVPHRLASWAAVVSRELAQPDSAAIAVRYPRWSLRHKILNQLMGTWILRRPRLLTRALIDVVALFRERLPRAAG